MPEPFLLSSIIISYVLHIGHIGYVIYKNRTVIKEEFVKIENDIIDIVENPSHLSEDIEKIKNELYKTTQIIESSDYIQII